MYDSPQALGFETIYVRLIDFCEGACPFCGSTEVIELYPDAGHSFLTMKGWLNLIDYWFECCNPDCTGPHRFKAPHPYVLPYKKLGRDIWGFICKESERYRSDVPQIRLRLHDVGVELSEDTIRTILDEYRLLKEDRIDEKTLKVVRAQAKMIIGTDGTPTEQGQPSLWTFYDVLSGRLLYAEYLLHADAETLCKIFHKVASKYEVPVVGFLSDHQPSIVNACKLYNPDLPHQTCHYHFLRNLWDFIEIKDTHMNGELRATVNALAINRPDLKGGREYSSGIKVEKAGFFAPLMHRLKQAVNNRTQEFDIFKGIRAYETLEKVTKELEMQLKTCRSTLTPVKQLRAAEMEIRERLELMAPEYHDLCALNARFQLIRETLGNPKMAKDEKISTLDRIFREMWEEASPRMRYADISEVSSTAPKYDQSNAHIYCQWCRLWTSHQGNLFRYYDVPGMEKTNIYNEQIFSQVKQYAQETVGIAHKNYIILTRGERIVKEMCAKDTLSIHDVLSRYDVKGMRVLRAGLDKRISEQTRRFRNAPENLDAITIIIQQIKKRSWEKREDL